jgi:hypothetical protein
MADARDILHDANAKDTTPDEHTGMALLVQCLDINNRPHDSRAAVEWVLMQGTAAFGSLITGARLEWFAYKMHEQCDTLSAEQPALQDKLVRLYMRATTLSQAQVADASHQYWPF